MNRIFIALGRLSRLLHYLQNPQENPQLAAIALGILVVIGLLIVALLYLIYINIAEAETKKTEALPKKRLKKMVIIMLSIFFILMIFTTYQSRNPKFCTNCHVNTKIGISWKRSSHKQTACFKCHQNPGLLGFLEYQIRGINNLVSFESGQWNEPIRTFVDDSSCYRCHSNIIEKTRTVRGLRVSHKEFLIKGAKCVSCHSGVGHMEVAAVIKSPQMEQCINCHNNKQVSGKCNICHVVDIAKTARSFGKDYAKVPMSDLTTCKGCHTPKTEANCIKCMSFEMPHPEGWAPEPFVIPGTQQTKPSHPPFGFKYFEKCIVCHNRGSICTECHNWSREENGNLRRNHGVDWINNHKSQPVNSNCGCHGQPDGGGWCKFCHGEKLQRRNPADLKFYSSPLAD